MPERPDPTLEEFSIFAQRYMHFMNLYTVYRDFLQGQYVPSLDYRGEDVYIPNVQSTLMFMLYGYFYSLVEHSENCLNAFRIWRARFPEEEKEIAEVEAQVEPLRDGLRLFRNRLGFHGSRTRAHESLGLDVFGDHSGTDVLVAIQRFKRLGAMLFDKDTLRQQGEVVKTS